MKTLAIDQMPQLPFQVSEAINQLRINLGFCGSQIKTIMITSSVPNEGKSFLTIQLWKRMAEVGTPVLLLDCDFRNSEMRRKYGIRSTDGGKLLGAAHCLAGQAQLEDVIYSTNIPQGYMIPVASTIANPTILLESPRFARMLEDCAGRFGCLHADVYFGALRFRLDGRLRGLPARDVVRETSVVRTHLTQKVVGRILGSDLVRACGDHRFIRDMG